MQFAIDPTGSRIEAVKGAAATCPSCGCEVFPRCGRIRLHHWAHRSGDDCDAWSEGETEWHRVWKSLFDREEIEVPLGPHRADIRTRNGLVIELQNSPISPQDIEQRERFYNKMIWLVNAERFAERFFLMKRMGDQVFSFKWKHMKPSWRFAKKPVYLDFGRYRVRDLLGGETAVMEEIFTPEGDLAPFAKLQIVRYAPGSEARLDPSMDILNESILGCHLLRLNTLHANGWGSVRPFTTSLICKNWNVSPH